MLILWLQRYSSLALVGLLAAATSLSVSSAARGGTVRGGAFAVDEVRLDLVERNAAVGGATRSLPTTVWYPVLPQAGAAPPARTRAPYPLLVFSQGYDVSVSMYAPLLSTLASAGFVVAAPAYPHTSPSDGAGLDESDILHHPDDLRFAITALLRVGHSRHSPLSGMLDRREIGILGHSDGGDVTLAVAADSCCHDARVKAAAVLSGAELTSFGGRYFAAAPPLLVVQGTADSVNVPSCSAQIYAGAPQPRYYLEMLGASHTAPYIGRSAGERIVARVLVDFFRAQLAAVRSAPAAMAADGNVAHRARLTHAALAPPAPGHCPGAPD